MRRNREREKKKLKEKEAELYAKLGTHCLTMCSVYIQSEKDLQEMKLRVQALEQEKVIVCQHSGIEKIAWKTLCYIGNSNHESEVWQIMKSV